MKELFEGPWRVVDKSTLGDRPRPAPGEIIKHRSGAVVLCCPACGAMQFAHAPVVGNDARPTITKPIQCGSGNCKQCGIWFSIDAGHTVLMNAPPPKRPPRAIPERLVKAGVKEAPKLPDDLR
jgi:hypothetical protein